MSGENIRTFLIMSHGSWPEKIIKADAKGRQYAANGPLHINFKEFKEHHIWGKYKDIADTGYTIPNKTRLFTTTNYGKSAIACPKYDEFIKNYIRKYGINIFTSPELINSLNQKYEFIEQCRLYTDGDKIVNIEISFEDDRKSWNMWEKDGRYLKPVPNLDLTQKYSISDFINYLTSTAENGGIAVPNQKTHIILHCCNPFLYKESWTKEEYMQLNRKIVEMMSLGKLQIERIWRENLFKIAKKQKRSVKQYRTRMGVINKLNMTVKNNSLKWSNQWHGLNPNYRFSRNLGKFVKKGRNLTIKRTTARSKRTKPIYRSRRTKTTSRSKRSKSTAGKKRPTTAGKKRPTTAGKKRPTTAGKK